MNLQSIARALGGEVVSGAVSCPGPGHSPKDRSLRVFLDWQAPDGFRTGSLAGDDWRVCRDHVRAKLGIRDDGRPFAPRRDNPPTEHLPTDDTARTTRALAIWGEAKP